LCPGERGGHAEKKATEKPDDGFKEFWDIVAWEKERGQEPGNFQKEKKKEPELRTVEEKPY